MTTLSTGQKLTVYYDNGNKNDEGLKRRSKFSIEKSIAVFVESNTGKTFKSWVQEQYDLLSSNQKTLSKYCHHMKFGEGKITPRKIGSVIRLMAHEAAFKDIPDAEL